MSADRGLKVSIHPLLEKSSFKNEGGDVCGTLYENAQNKNNNGYLCCISMGL